MYPQPIILKTTTVLDGRGTVLRNRSIVVDGSTIRSVGPMSAKATYDLSGLTVMPVWIDTHVHITWHFDKNGRLADDERESPQQAVLAGAANVTDIDGRVHDGTERWSPK
jgi:imidazolonepropionase-like amidohydrolase